MYVWENDTDVGRMRREQGSWGCVVVLKTGRYGSGEEIVENECGTFPLEEEIRMAEQTGSVGCSCGLTINMGNYESARCDAWLTLPCTDKTTDEAYDKCHKFVAAKVQEKAEKYANIRKNKNA